MQEELKDQVREATTEVILALRAEYLAAGASPLKHWDQIQDRVRAAARQAADLPTWVTAVARSLNLQAPSNYRSSATLALDDLVHAEEIGASRWLAMIEDEHGYLMAIARVKADARREARQEEAGRATEERLDF